MISKIALFFFIVIICGAGVAFYKSRQTEPVKHFINERETTEKRGPGRPPKSKTETPKDSIIQVRNENILKRSGLNEMPIPIGASKIWYVFIDEDYSNEDIKKFTQLIELALTKSEDSE